MFINLFNKNKKFFYAAIFIASILVLIYFGQYFKDIYTSASAIQSWVLKWGDWAPIATIIIEAMQVIIAPLNNFFTNFAAGYIFGPYLGALYSYAGWIMGAIVVFWFCRLFGRSFVNLFFKDEQLAKFDILVNQSHFVIFMLFLLPGPPDDLIVYLLGLSNGMGFRRFLLIVLISKFPGKLTTAYLGAGLANHSQISLVIYAIFIVTSLLIYWKNPHLWQLWRKKKG